MEIRIEFLGTEESIDGGSYVTNRYSVGEDGREFFIACSTHLDGRSVSLEGEKGSLHVDTDKDIVYRQTVALGGGCGLLIDDEPVAGLSPSALLAVINADKEKRGG